MSSIKSKGGDKLSGVEGPSILNTLELPFLLLVCLSLP